jgi:hypothetical protein
MLNTEGFSPGLYFIQKTDDAGKILDVQKLIIKRE